MHGDLKQGDLKEGDPTGLHDAEAARLDAALDRIARAGARPAPGSVAGSVAGRATEHAALAARLDVLIAELRAILGT